MAAPTDRNNIRQNIRNMNANAQNQQPFGQFLNPQTFSQPHFNQQPHNIQRFTNQNIQNSNQLPNNTRFERPQRFQSNAIRNRFQAPPTAFHPRQSQVGPVRERFERPSWNEQSYNQEQQFNKLQPCSEQPWNLQQGFNQQLPRPTINEEFSHQQSFNKPMFPMQQNRFNSPRQEHLNDPNMQWHFDGYNPAKNMPAPFNQGGIPEIAPSVYQESFNTRVKDRKDDQSESDRRWIDRFLSKQESKHGNLPQSRISISEAHDKTRHVMVLLAKLQKHTQLLETMKDEDASIWEQKLKEVKKIKNEVEVAQEDLTNTQTVAALEKKIKKRRQKRARVKRLRQEAYETRQLELTAREEKHTQIDKAMHLIAEKQKLQKQEAEMQREGDAILSQVRKKLTETFRAQELIEGLQTLRAIRADRLERQGVLGMYESQARLMSRKLMFDAQLTNLKDLLCSQIKTYKAEESTLEVLLESEHQETREKEQEKSRQRLADKLRQKQERENGMLFGQHRDPEPGDPLYPFRQFYDAAGHSLDALVSIRRDWDMFLVVPETVGASCIPDHYICPSEPASDVWSTALTTTDT